jgi:Mg-chelatase subunit ChlI
VNGQEISGANPKNPLLDGKSPLSTITRARARVRDTTRPPRGPARGEISARQEATISRVRGTDGCYRPTTLPDRAARIRRSARARYTAAETGLERFAAAVDYLRAAASACQRAGIGGVGDILGRVTVAVMAAGDELTAALDGEGQR